MLSIIVVFFPVWAFLSALPLLFLSIVPAPALGSLSRVFLSVIERDVLLSIVVSAMRESLWFSGLSVDRFPALDVLSDCLPIGLNIPRLLLEFRRLFRLAADWFASLDGGILLGLITLPIRSARSIELTRLFELTVGCLALFEGGVLVGLFTLSMIDVLRLVEFVVDNFLVLDDEV